MEYAQKLDTLLSPAERRVFKRLSTPQKIQDFLDTLPANVLYSNQHTMRSPRRVLRDKTAHCLEGAMLAAAVLAYHGRNPLLMDLASVEHDYDHSVALFKINGLWGAISKTNYPVLRWRDPVYKSPRELVMSYFHEYFVDSGQKTMRSYTLPFNIKKFDPTKWVVAEDDVDWMAEELGRAPHYPIAPATVIKKLRKATRIEIKTTLNREWTKQGKRLF